MKRLEEEEARLEREEQEKQKTSAVVETKGDTVEKVKETQSAVNDEAEKREKARSTEERAKEQEEKARQAAWGTRLGKTSAPSPAVAPASAPAPASRPKSPVSASRMRSDDMPRDTARLRAGSPGGKWKHDGRATEPPRRPPAVSLASSVLVTHIHIHFWTLFRKR
jgi:hypothetical protein